MNEIIGRTQETADFFERVQKNPIVVIEGLSGSGKSVFAAHTAAQFEQQGYLPCFIHSAGSGQMFEQIHAFLKTRGIQSSEKSPQDAVKSVCSKVKLAVYADDFFEAKAPEPFLKTFSDSGSSKLIVITSKTVPALKHYAAASLKLAGLCRKDAETLINSLLSFHGIELPYDDIAAICRMTHGHPLMIKLILGLVVAGEFDAVREYDTLSSDEYYGIIFEKLFSSLNESDTALLKMLAVFRKPVNSALLTRMFSCAESLNTLLKFYIADTQPAGIALHSIIKHHMLNTFDCEAEHKNALRYWQQAIKDNPEDSVPIMESLYHSLTFNDYQTAEKVFCDNCIQLMLSGQYSAALDAADIIIQKTGSKKAEILKIRIETLAENAEKSMQKLKKINPESLTKEERIIYHDTCANCYFTLGRMNDAITEYKVEQTLHPADDLTALAKCYTKIGHALHCSNNLAGASEYYQKIIPLAEKIAPFDRGQFYNTMALLAFEHRKVEESIQYLEKALKIYKKLKLKLQQARMLSNLGSVYGALNRHDVSIDLQKKALKLQKELSDCRGIVFSNNNIALYYRGKRQFTKALSHHLEAYKTACTIHDIELIPICARNLSVLYLMCGKPLDAKKIACEGLAFSEAENLAYGRLILTEQLATAHLIHREFDQALQKIHEAYAICSDFSFDKQRQMIIIIESLIHAETGDTKKAAKVLTTFTSSHIFTVALKHYIEYLISKKPADLKIYEESYERLADVEKDIVALYIRRENSDAVQKTDDTGISADCRTFELNVSGKIIDFSKEQTLFQLLATILKVHPEPVSAESLYAECYKDKKHTSKPEDIIYNAVKNLRKKVFPLEIKNTKSGYRLKRSLCCSVIESKGLEGPEYSIIQLLISEPSSASEIMKKLNMSKTTLHRHLTSLVASGKIKTTGTGRATKYEIV